MRKEVSLNLSAKSGNESVFRCYIYYPDGSIVLIHSYIQRRCYHRILYFDRFFSNRKIVGLKYLSNRLHSARFMSMNSLNFSTTFFIVLFLNLLAQNITKYLPIKHTPRDLISLAPLLSNSFIHSSFVLSSTCLTSMSGIVLPPF